MTDMIKGIDYIGVCVVYVCHDGKGNFVMAKRSQNARDEQGRWDIGGGAMEFGATIEETLRKEILEEYCADVLNYQFLGYRDVHRIHNDRPTHWLALDFKVQVNPAKVRIGEPHKFDEIGWFTPSSMPVDVHSAVPTIFESYKEKLF